MIELKCLFWTKSSGKSHNAEGVAVRDFQESTNCL